MPAFNHGCARRDTTAQPAKSVARAGMRRLRGSAMRHLISTISLIGAAAGLLLFYFIMYVPETDTPISGYRARVGVAGIGLLLTGVGLVLRQVLGQPEITVPDRT